MLQWYSVCIEWWHFNILGFSSVSDFPAIVRRKKYVESSRNKFLVMHKNSHRDAHDGIFSQQSINRVHNNKWQQEKSLLKDTKSFLDGPLISIWCHKFYTTWVNSIDDYVIDDGNWIFCYHNALDTNIDPPREEKKLANNIPCCAVRNWYRMWWCEGEEFCSHFSPWLNVHLRIF